MMVVAKLRTKVYTPCLGFGVLFLACSVYGPELLDSSSNGGSSGAGGRGSDADGSASGGLGGSAATSPIADAEVPIHDGPNDCGGTRTIPPRPDPNSIINANGDVGEIVVAMHEVSLGDGRPNAMNPPRFFLDVGLDIDGICTRTDNQGAGECLLPEWATGSLDGSQGTDNSFGAFVQSVRDAVGDSFSSEQYTRQIQAGGTSILIRMRGYNGELNDESVSVAVFTGAPFGSDKEGGAAPAWNGSDAWPVASESVENPSASEPLESPKYVDSAAYVTDGRLAATFPLLSVRVEVGLSALSTSKLDLQLSRALVVCGLTAGDGAQYQADNCVLAGRSNANHLLRQLSTFSDPTSPSGLAPLCTDSAPYDSFKQNLCSVTDSHDMEGATLLPCNALSVGIHFNARPALLGSIWALDSIAARCPQQTDPGRDCCESLAPGGTPCPSN